jgi:lambda family phage portal protein
MILDQFGRPIDTRAIAAEQRTAARARIRESLAASYDAAATTTENAKHWRHTDSRSAASANSASVRKTLRERSRYECLENNSFAKGIALTLANDTISTGPSLQVTLDDRDASRAIERQWRKWCKDVRLANKLRTARLAKIIDGETFILKGTNRRSRNSVQLDVRIIEADQIATPNYVEFYPNKIDGIEFDEWGQPTVYHLLRGHPGDSYPWAAWDKDDISPDDIIHLYRAERPGQCRGIPEMTTALPLFAMIRRYTLAVILAAEIAADFTAILKTQANAFDSASDGVDDLEPFDFTQIDRGVMTSLPKGWDLQQFDPKQPTTTYTEFRNAILNEVARCVHMPQNKARADSSGYNYSSGRLDHQTYYESIAVERSQWEIECLDRIFEWWMDEALLLDGYLPKIDTMDEVAHVWRWPPNRDVDPKELAESSLLLINGGLKTRAQYLLEQNIDPEEHARQLEAEGWVDPQQVSAAAEMAKAQSVAPAADNPASSFAEDLSADPASPPPTGEFANMSRLQLQRNMKAIDDAVAKVASGEWTVNRARVFLSSLGLTERTVNALLDELPADVQSDA